MVVVWVTMEIWLDGFSSVVIIVFQPDVVLGTYLSILFVTAFDNSTINRTSRWLFYVCYHGNMAWWLNGFWLKALNWVDHFKFLWPVLMFVDVFKNIKQMQIVNLIVPFLFYFIFLFFLFSSFIIHIFLFYKYS